MMIDRVRAATGGRWLLFLLALNFALFFTRIQAIGLPVEAPAEQVWGFIQEKTKEGHPYMTGGIGLGEREAMEKQSGEYNLKLLFANSAGQFLSKVSLTIMDQKGNETISTTAEGPFFYIKLPSGAYSVKADFEGNTREIKKLDLSKGKRVVRLLRWPETK